MRPEKYFCCHLERAEVPILIPTESHRARDAEIYVNSVYHGEAHPRHETQVKYSSYYIAAKLPGCRLAGEAVRLMSKISLGATVTQY